MTKTLIKINKFWTLAGGGLLLLIAFLIKNTFPSPYILLHQTESLMVLPPLWILGIWWMAGYFLVGCVAGQIFSLKALSPTADIKRYQGGMCMILAVVCSFLWYALLFGTEAFLFSWLMCGMAFAFLCLCLKAWICVPHGCAWWLLPVTISSLLLFVLQFMVMLHI